MTAALLLTALLAVLSLFQLALVFGAPLGHFTLGGRHRVLPRRLRPVCVVSIAVYALIAMIALDRSGRIDVFPDSFSAAGIWVVFAYSVLSIGLNGISRSRPERFTMAPVSALMAVLSLIVALG